MVVVGGRGVASREFEFEANCWRRCSNVFMLLRCSLIGMPASESSGYCLPIEQASLQRCLIDHIETLCSCVIFEVTQMAGNPNTIFWGWLNIGTANQIIR